MRPMFALVLAAGAFTAACGGSPARDTAGGGCPVDARPANLSFTLKGLDGRNVRLADYKGRIVFLNFWATWCVPCRAEIPVLVELQDRYRSDGLEVVGIVTLDEFANAGPFAERHRMNYTIVDGTTRTDVEEAYGPLPGIPTSFVIARNGTVCYHHVGVPRPKEGETLEDGIRRTFEAEIRSLL
jgi:thiol-disulfide isomerase/thioredoxin